MSTEGSDDLPDEASSEEVQYQLYVRRKIEQGLGDVAAGRTLSAEEFDRRMEKWLAP